MKAVLLADDPRFASIFARLQDDITMVQRRVTAQTLRPLCSIVTTDADGKVVHVRQATDAEIADGGSVFEAQRSIALAAGYRAARAAAKRLSRYYGLRSRYAAH